MIRTLTLPCDLIPPPTMVRGGGSVAISQPAAVGDSGAPGYGENVIARWNVVPYLETATTLKVGVVAFHIEGMDRVDFRVDGGQWVSVDTMTLNSDSGTVEYWATLDASLHADGPVTVQAVAYPVSGVPRVLPDLVLNTNAGGTLPHAEIYVSPSGNDSNNGLTAGAPKATIYDAIAAGKTLLGGNPSGLTIYLAAGSYTILGSQGDWDRYVGAMSRWMTIRPAPGVASSSVIIAGRSGNDGIVQQLVRFSGVTVNGAVIGAPSGYVASRMWWDDCDFIGLGTNRYDVDFGDTQASAKYYTGCSFTHCKNGPDSAELVRDCTIEQVAEGGDRNCGITVNTTINDINPGALLGTLHPDGLQITTSLPNVIYYGVTLSNLDTVIFRYQGNGQDVALVNVVGNAGSAPYAWEIERRYQNFYIKGGSWTGAFVYDGTVDTINVVFEDVTMPTPPSARAGVTFR